MSEVQKIKLDKISRIQVDNNNMYDFIKQLYPICRSITGNGVRETLKILQEKIPLKIFEVASGTKVFDWTVPNEWNIKDAYIKDFNGKKIIDFKKSNLHILNYSVPINKKMPLDELKKHLYTLPDYPDRIPYLTSYYKENWGFCLSHKQYQDLEDGMYEVVIDSSLKKGSLTYGELFVPGESDEEILFSCYVCHPSMCNDSLSGVAVLTFLAQNLLNQDLKYSYRFLFIPETIGSITWLALNEKTISQIKYGLVATCLGDSGCMTYKKTKKGNTFLDKVVGKVLMDSGNSYKIIDFDPCGSDERQFCSPGINLDIGSLMRTSYGCFDEYHTSADNLNFVQQEYLLESFEKYLDIIFIIENNKYYLNLNPKCEPQLGKRGLYNSIGSQKKSREISEAFFWILNFSDGNYSLLDIAIRSGISFEYMKKATDYLLSSGLLKSVK